MAGDMFLQTGSRCEQPALSRERAISRTRTWIRTSSSSPSSLQFKLDCFWFFLNFPFLSLFWRDSYLFPISWRKGFIMSEETHREKKNLQEAEGRLGKSVPLHTILQLFLTRPVKTGHWNDNGWDPQHQPLNFIFLRYFSQQLGRWLFSL